MAANEHVLEFKTDVGRTPRIEDLYKVRRERSVEIHLCDASRPDRHPDLLERSRPVQIDGNSYPALCREDMFLSQAWHLFRHVRSEWVRISWLLELRHFIIRYYKDSALWSAIEMRANLAPYAQTTVGVVAQFAEAVLGSFAPRELTRWSLPQVSPDTALWIERYANKVALTDFPGSKLYLILEQTLSTATPGATSDAASSRLVRLQRWSLRQRKGLVQRVEALFSRARYFCFRLKFHLMSTSQYLWEYWLWNRKQRHSLRQSYTPGRCSAGTVD